MKITYKIAITITFLIAVFLFLKTPIPRYEIVEHIVDGVIFNIEHGAIEHVYCEETKIETDCLCDWNIPSEAYGDCYEYVGNKLKTGTPKCFHETKTICYVKEKIKLNKKL